MKQEIKLKLQPRGRLTIPETYRMADNLQPGDLLKIVVEKIRVKKEVEGQ